MFSGPLKGKTEIDNFSYLMVGAGENGEAYTLWDLSQDESKKWQINYEKVEQYVKPRSNVIFNRYKFQSRIQTEGESFEQFATEIQTLV